MNSRFNGLIRKGVQSNLCKYAAKISKTTICTLEVAKMNVLRIDVSILIGLASRYYVYNVCKPKCLEIKNVNKEN